MNDDLLDRIFRALPRERADRFFTARVMSRVAADPPVRRNGLAPRFAVAAAAAIVVAVGLAAGFAIERGAAMAPAVTATADGDAAGTPRALGVNPQLAALRREERALRQELAAIATELQRVDSLVVAGDERLSLVIRLDQGDSGDRKGSPSHPQPPKNTT